MTKDDFPEKSEEAPPKIPPPVEFELLKRFVDFWKRDPAVEAPNNDPGVENKDFLGSYFTSSLFSSIGFDVSAGLSSGFLTSVCLLKIDANAGFAGSELLETSSCFCSSYLLTSSF